MADFPDEISDPKVLLSRRDFTEAPLRVETVDVPYFGRVRIREMPNRIRENVEHQILKGVKINDNRGVRALLAVHSLVGENDALIFSEKDLDLVGDFATAPLDAIFDAAIALNRMNPEHTKKNSARMAAGNSNTASPSP